jgi:CrcB protein
MTTALLVAVAGAAGVLARYGLTTVASGDGLLWTTLVINVAGSFLLGVLGAGDWGSATSRTALGAGFLGGFTTYSTFSVQAVTTAESGRWLTAGVYVGGSLLLGVAAALAGLALGRLLR